MCVYCALQIKQTSPNTDVVPISDLCKLYQKMGSNSSTSIDEG